jgi:hypothetical protein
MKRCAICSILLMVGCVTQEVKPPTVVTPTTPTTPTTTTTIPPVDHNFPPSIRNNAVEDVAAWDETVAIGSVKFEPHRITWRYLDGTEVRQQLWEMTAKSRRERLNGTLCALIERNGKWHQCNLDSLRPGMSWQTRAPFTSHGNLLKSPLRNWKARRGERLGIYVTGVNWVYGVGTRERSNVVWIEYE